MFHSLTIRRSLSILCLLLVFWLQLATGPGSIAWAASTPNSPPVAEANRAEYDWVTIDRELVAILKTVRPSTDEFAASELDRWMDARMQQVDGRFLKWYFSFIHQKATQDGVPFAWLAFKVDALDWLKADDEIGLTPNEIIQRRMLKEFDQKFNEMVFSEAAIADLKDRIERVAQNYASAVGLRFDMVKIKYRISNRDWEMHMGQLAQLTHGTGTSQSSLSSESLTSLLTSRATAVVGVAVASKLAVKFAVKLAPKLATKGAVLALQGMSKFVDPLLIVGLLVWDITDHQRMVQNSRPVLRQNIEDYLAEMKADIYDSPDGSIISALDEVENQIADLIAATL